MIVVLNFNFVKISNHCYQYLTNLSRDKEVFILYLALIMFFSDYSIAALIKLLHSFLYLHSVSWYEYATFLTSLTLVGIWLVSTSFAIKNCKKSSMCTFHTSVQYIPRIFALQQILPNHSDRGCTSLNSHQQCTGVPVLLYLGQQNMLSDFI